MATRLADSATALGRHIPSLSAGKDWFYLTLSISLTLGLGMDSPRPPLYWRSTDTFSHHYQRRIDFNTINLFHFAGMDLAYILANREGLTNPLPRGRIDQSFPKGQDWPILSLQRIGHPSSRDDHTAGDSMLRRQCTV